MLEIRFEGWFQCRLATDPDPYDEPRGVSGYVRAFVGEPNLDRVLRWQNPPFQRTHGPTIGVSVREVLVDGALSPTHPALNARVNLLSQPVFEGRNGVISEDGLEPVFPFNLEVAGDGIRLYREVIPSNTEFPFDEFLAEGVDASPEAGAAVLKASGYSTGLLPEWQRRLTLIHAALPNASPEAKPGLEERISSLQRKGNARFFQARMHYQYALKSRAHVEEKDPGALGPVDLVRPWRVAFWLGGWDPDVQCGIASGTLTVPFEHDPTPILQPRDPRLARTMFR